MQIHGTCGNCGGPVVSEPNMSVIPLPPSCKQCGAMPSRPFGPTIPMERKGIRIREAAVQDAFRPRMN